MTEADWLNCTDPKPMLEFVRRIGSERKLRLFGVAVSRQFRDQLDLQAIADGLETAERYADTRKTKSALKRARQELKTIRHGIPGGDRTRVVEWVALWLAEVVASENAFGGVGADVVRLASLGLIGPDKPTSMVELMSCIFGSLPFNPVSLDLPHLAPPLVSLAQTIYDDRAFGRMLELAVALERAGCHDTELLAHCRGPGPHVRGCWVLDLILGRSSP